MNQKGNIAIYILCGLLVLVVIAGGIYYYFSKLNNSKTSNPTPNDTGSLTNIYKAQDNSFSFNYPSNWTFDLGIVDMAPNTTNLVLSRTITFRNNQIPKPVLKSNPDEDFKTIETSNLLIFINTTKADIGSQDLDTYVKSNFKNYLTSQHIKIGNLDVDEVHYNKCSVISLNIECISDTFKQGNNLYQFIIHTNTGDLNITHNIISTFKFTN